jgi:ATP-dependent exoDNAse (exonuclease V) beta subunit
MTHLGRPPGWEDEPPHLLIRASAGSGKTYRLSSRYLRLLRRGARPESILATTFTRKAAGEVLARVVTRLAAATDDDATRAVLAGDLPGRSLTREACLAMLRGLADDLHRLSISTIDSFFNRIAQSFARELDLPPEPMVVDDTHPAVEQVRLDAIEAMLGDADLPGMVALLRQFHHDQAARSVTDALSDIIRQTHEVYRESPTREAWSRLNPNGLLDEDGLQAATKALLDAADDLPKTTRSWTDAYAKNRDAALARDWEEFLKVGLAKAVCRGGGLYYNTPIEGKLLDALTPLIDHAAVKMIERLGLQTVATYDLLHRFDEHSRPRTARDRRRPDRGHVLPA